MRILTDAHTFANLIDSPEARYDAFVLARYSPDRETVDHRRRSAPTEFDLAEYAAWLRATDAEAHAGPDEPTPVEVLDRDDAPWWASLPTEPELDGFIYEPTGPMTDADLDANARWAAEGEGVRGRASRRLSDFDQDHYRHLGRG